MDIVTRAELEAALTVIHRRLDALQEDQAPLRLLNAIRHRLTPAPPPVPPAEPTPAPGPTDYANLYEQHARNMSPDSSIGDGNFDHIGRVELSILIDAGLKPTSFLLDFGCGTGRLAVHAVPYLAQGRYLGTDISPTMLRHADTYLRRALGDMPPYAEFIVQPEEEFPTATPPDMICAYSVFTHMEHEDSYRYLMSARKVSGPNTVFVASVLPLELQSAQNVFLTSAASTLAERWARVRNVVTTGEQFGMVAKLAGWDVISWHAGDKPATTLPDGTPAALGQSVVILQPSDG